MAIKDALFRKEAFAIGVSVVTAVSFSVPTLKSSLFLKNYASFYTKKGQTGKPLKIPEHIEREFNEVLDEMNFTDLGKKFVKIFITHKWDPFYAGSTKSQYGLMIGLPEYFRHKTREDVINSKNILIDKKPVQWASTDGELLADSLLLSEKARKYVMLKHLELCNTYEYLVSASVTCIITFVYYISCCKIHQVFKLAEKPMYRTAFIHGTVTFLYYQLWHFLQDGMKLAYDRSAEDRTLNVGALYILGGIEYYEKLLNRNRALRNLMKKGEKYYTVLGSEKYFIRQKSIPPAFKKAYLEHALKIYSGLQAEKEMPPLKEPKNHSQSLFGN